MRVDWYGQSAFRLATAEQTVFIDPFGDMSAASSRGLQFDYPAISGIDAALVLVTHEHVDHNGVEVIGGDPAILRATPGSHESPVGEVVGIASEHDDVAGIARGANTIFSFSLGGVRVAHFGDFGQSALRPEQRAALGAVDLLIVPVGGGPTIGADGAAEIVTALSPRWVVPMHYRTSRTNFLETADEFLGRVERVERCSEPGFDTDALARAEGPLAVVPAAP